MLFINDTSANNVKAYPHRRFVQVMYYFVIKKKYVVPA